MPTAYAQNWHAHPAWVPSLDRSRTTRERGIFERESKVPVEAVHAAGVYRGRGNAADGLLPGFFRDLTENRLRRGVFHSVLELIDALDEYIDQHNDAPKPFIWTAKAKDILAKVMRARAVFTGRSV